RLRMPQEVAMRFPVPVSLTAERTGSILALKTLTDGMNIAFYESAPSNHTHCAQNFPHVHLASSRSTTVNRRSCTDKDEITLLYGSINHEDVTRPIAGANFFGSGLVPATVCPTGSNHSLR